MEPSGLKQTAQPSAALHAPSRRTGFPKAGVVLLPFPAQIEQAHLSFALQCETAWGWIKCVCVS
jgi:hypothetical protein